MKTLISNIRFFYFIGIGGIGMSAIARYFKVSNKFVAGYDKYESNLTSKLINEGIIIHFEDDINFIPKEIKNSNKSEILIIYTPAVPESNSELNFFIKNGFNVKKRAEVLGLISNNYKTIAVAGTHGKTSVSTIIAYIFERAGLNMNAILGGISKNYNSNLVISNNVQDAEYLVTEADEFDRSFLHLHTHTAIVTAIDEDHLDIYKDINDLKQTFNKFINQIYKNGNFLIKKGVHINKNNLPKNYFTYSGNEEADFFAKNIISENEKSIFDLKMPIGEIKNIELKLPGRINIENAVAAISVAVLHNISQKHIKQALATWTGVKRRFDYMLRTDKITYIDDYAHHPEEVYALISSVKEMYPKKKITGIFQPHLYTRTRDFADGFAENLSLLDELILLDIYPAREKPIKGISSGLIFEKVKIKNKILCHKDKLIEVIKNKKIEILLTIGAGDIGKLTNDILAVLRSKKFE